MDPFSLNLIMIIGFVIGSGLIIVEAFIPGFGVAGISGVILEIIALRCCWLGYGTVPTLLALAGDMGCSAGPGLVGLLSGTFERTMEVTAALKTGIRFGVIFPILLIVMLVLLTIGRKAKRN